MIKVNEKGNIKNTKNGVILSSSGSGVLNLEQSRPDPENK